MMKTKVSNPIMKVMHKALTDNLYEERSKLIQSLIDFGFESKDLCRSIVWKKTYGNISAVAVLNNYEFVIQFEDERTISEIIVSTHNKYIASNIDCADSTTTEIVNKVYDIFGVERIF